MLPKKRFGPVLLIGLLLPVAAAVLMSDLLWATHETPFGEIELRPGPAFRRRCLAGINAGMLCNENANCPASSCPDRNVFNLTVSVRFNATPGQLATIQTRMDEMADSLWDATDGQVQIGEVFIFNNSMGAGGDIWVQAGSGLSATSGHWAIGGKINAGMNTLTGSASSGEGMAHEFVHLIFDARDEYESRAVGCLGLVGGAQCPTAVGEERCLMDVGGLNGGGTELCWAGNHEPALITEQSRCRSNRSCWEQIGWSWPNTMLLPAAAPDPVPPAGLDPLVFIQPPATARIVLVLDTSGSMDAETPSRIARLKTAALDFVTLAEDGVELGVVSFNTNATDEVPIGALGPVRAAYTTAINDLCTGPGDCVGWTNIGDGLRHAADMIDAAGGVTINTSIVLMTDGINNRPLPDPDGDLTGTLADLNADGIPVYVTCTGGDFGLESQCAEIAAATGGEYVDSADADNVPEAFSLFHEVIMGGQIVASHSGTFLPTLPPSGFVGNYTAMIEPGARQASFTLQWRNPGTEGRLLVVDPLGNQYLGDPMDLGQFVRVPDPAPGDWRVSILQLRGGLNAPDPYLSRAYVASQPVAIPAASRVHVVEPGNPMVIHAFPLFDVPLQNCIVNGTVRDPAGVIGPIMLVDEGRTAADTGDDIANDGVYTATLTKTTMPGPYQFHLKVDCSAAEIVEHHPPGQPGHDTVIQPYVREVLFTAVVNDAPLSAGREICTGNAFGEPGTSVKVPIFLFDGTDVAGFQVEALFNPAILTPLGVSLGADTAAAGGWTVSSATVGPGILRILGASNPPAALGSGFQEVALVEFQIAPGSPSSTETIGLQKCILGDEAGLEIPCHVCSEPGGVIVRPASRFEFRPVPSPIGVDLFDPLPFPLGAEALNFVGGLATGYNGIASILIPSPPCSSKLVPNTMPFSGGVGFDSYEVQCCTDTLLPNTTFNNTFEMTDPGISISGVSGPWLGVAKGDLDASNSVDILDVTRTVRLSLGLPVGLPPPHNFQRWAGDMLSATCVADGTNNVLDVIRVENKALNLPALCRCTPIGSGALESEAPTAQAATAGPIDLRLEKAGKGDFLVVVGDAADLGGFQLELRGAGPKASVTLEGLTSGSNWQVASRFHRGVLRVIAYSSNATGVSGDGPVLRISGATRPRLGEVIVSDSRGNEIPRR